MAKILSHPNVPNEKLTCCKSTFKGALNIEKSELSYLWSKAQLEQQRKNSEMSYEEFEKFYNQLNKED